MTPTLMGRWQTRILLILTLGLAITFIYMQRFGAFEPAVSDSARWKLPMLLGYVTLFGLAWDCLYTHLQGYRWDRDWPLAYQCLGGLVEGVVVFALFRLDLLPGAQYGTGEWSRFALHYGTVWLATYLCILGPIRVLLPRWRFAGGEIFRPLPVELDPVRSSRSTIAPPESLEELVASDVQKAVEVSTEERPTVLSG